MLDHSSISAPWDPQRSLEPVEVVQDQHWRPGGVPSIPAGEQGTPGVQRSIQGPSDSLGGPAASVLDMVGIAAVHVCSGGKVSQRQSHVGTSAGQISGEARPGVHRAASQCRLRCRLRPEATVTVWCLFHCDATVGYMTDDHGRNGSTPHETYRAVLPAHTPGGEPSTLIVTRQGLGRDGRVWLTFNGAIKTTVEMTDGQTTQLTKLLDGATRPR